ncbi:hypothetical protein CBI36_04625 [Acetobacter oryzifermentans]|uniref:Uncharacterized protein n=3 Tax=Acetobacteraceae TaxID=433 RepID=A0AAN1U9D0_9PROT|nr:hypothetical protein WG31_04785 [Acetobacter oryzifermentans]ASL39795.1 hypothetical protein CBI36_04625 [Acetobacter oryzifermentans]ATI11558.1 hypothetical protein CPF11_03175 [Acetobacter pomorum]AXC26106.1 hypothetical protein DS739_04495 [Acetobacter sp. JWB]AXN00774.1 hypothetical protein CJF59_09580 [Acetobacter pomorum]
MEAVMDQKVPRADIRYVSVSDWITRTGMSRTDTYRKLGDGSLHGKKIGRKTVIDFQAGLTWLASLPDAEIITK